MRPKEKPLLRQETEALKSMNTHKENYNGLSKYADKRRTHLQKVLFA